MQIYPIFLHIFIIFPPPDNKSLTCYPPDYPNIPPLRLDQRVVNCNNCYFLISSLCFSNLLFFYQITKWQPTNCCVLQYKQFHAKVIDNEENRVLRHHKVFITSFIVCSKRYSEVPNKHPPPRINFSEILPKTLPLIFINTACTTHAFILAPFIHYLTLPYLILLLLRNIFGTPPLPRLFQPPAY